MRSSKVREGGAFGRGRVFDSVIALIGNTPLVRINAMAEASGARATILAKLEFMNPLASVKDRIALAMVEAAEAERAITPGRTVLIEPTSGNTGIALAFVAAVKGYRLIVVAPESLSIERQHMITHFGAKLELTPAQLGMTGAIEQAKALASELKEAHILEQFSNPANPLVHAATTAEEIWADTGGKVDMIVAGVGTGGTLAGCAKALKSRQKKLRVVAVEPAESPVLSQGKPSVHKIQGIGAGFIPSTFDVSLVDEVIAVSNEVAFATAREAAKSEGLPIGISSGAALHAALQVAARVEMAGKTIVVIIPSSAERELSTTLFDASAAVVSRPKP